MTCFFYEIDKDLESRTDLVVNRRLFSSKVKFLFFLKFNLTKVWQKTIATIWRNPLLRESWFCEKVMWRLQGTVVECVIPAWS